MNFTKEEIHKMVEKDLREKVLIPLFDKMKFQDIDHYHGINEKGKDIIMWEEDLIGARIYISVVVKSTKINGKASGKSSAGEVSTQVHQSFNIKFKDKITGNDSRIEKVWVVSNKTISKEAIETIFELNTGKSIRFINIEKLYELYQEYLPESPQQKITNASSELDSISPNWSLGFQKKGENTFFYPEPKHEKADEIEPLNFTFTFNRELVAQNKSVHDLLYNPELVNHPVHIPMEMIIDVQSGDFLKKAMNIQEIRNGFVIIPIKQTPNKYEFSFIDIYSNEFLFDNIELSCEKEENDIAVFSNINQNVPYKLTFTFEKEILNKNKITFSMFVKKHGYELKNILKGLKLFNSLSNGGIIKFREKSSQKELYTQEIATGFISINYKEYINLLERIYYIQMKTNINTINLKNEISNDQIFEINKLYYILQGYLSIQDFESWKIILPVDKAKEIFLKLNIDKTISFYDLDVNCEVNFFDNIINLGNVHSYCNAVYITEEEKRKIDEQFKNNVENIQMELLPYDNSKIILIFEKFINEKFKNEKPAELNEDIIRTLYNDMINKIDKNDNIKLINELESN